LERFEKVPRPYRRAARQWIRVRNPSRDFAALSLCLIFTACFAALATSAPQADERVRPGDYAEDNKCRSCHRDQEAFWKTAHHLTSTPPSKDSIAGKFREGENILRTSNPDLFYRMETTKDGFYQTAVLGTPPDTASLSRRFDFVIGSGRKGQTYLYWGENDRLFQLPVSYWTERGKWVNSPGYEDGDLNFGRSVLPRCLECHASYFESLSESGNGNRYNKANYILGISCARCHGPGQEHAAAQVSQAGKSSGQAIINPAKLSRARQVEACGLCHGGLGVGKVPAFSYVSGKPLGDYIQRGAPGPDEVVDVHGNQVALLERSRCFQSSNMTCSTCHNVHLTQRNAAAFSRSCQTCHKVESCGLFHMRGHRIAENCVDCHMPKLTSKSVVSRSEGRKMQPQVRTHWIRVYKRGNNP
jgi:hypothetical protein